MNLETLSQLAVGTTSVIVLWFVVREFLRHLKKRDDFLDKLIGNHFHDHTEALKKLTEAVNRVVNGKRN